MQKKMEILVVNLSRDAREILSATWRVGTEKKYKSHMKNFAKFCRKSYTDPIQGINGMEIEFLTEYFKTEVGYSSINSARSALASIIKLVCNVPFGKSPLICRLLKGVFNASLALPRSVATLDNTKLFTFIKSKPTLTDCDLKTVSHRLAMRLCLTTGQREQTIKRWDYIKISSESFQSCLKL